MDVPVDYSYGNYVSATRGSFIPQAGDLILFNWSESSFVWSHIGIVTAVDGNTVYYTDGNNGGAVHTDNSISKTSTKVIAYCRLNGNDLPVQLDGATNVQSKLAAVLADYPNNTKWTGTFDGAKTCYGFAGMVIYKVFGKSTVSGKTYRWWTYAGVSTSGMVNLGSVDSCTKDNVRQLLSKARPGDVLQFNAGSNGHQHSMIIYSIASSDSVQIYECNWTANTVTLTTLTCAQIAARQTRSDGTKRGKLSLLTSDNWESINGGAYTGQRINGNADLNSKPTISEATYPSGTLKVGSSFGLRGIISSGTQLSSVNAYIYDASGKAVLSYINNPSSTSYNIKSDGLNDRFAFGTLESGSYRYVVQEIGRAHV